jgi:hypothetical protein
MDTELNYITRWDLSVAVLGQCNTGHLWRITDCWLPPHSDLKVLVQCGMWHVAMYYYPTRPGNTVTGGTNGSGLSRHCFAAGNTRD